MLNIIQLSDIHLFEDPKKIYQNRNPYSQLEKAINHFNQNFLSKKIIILSGDLVSSVTRKTYELLSTILSQISSPIYVIPGNHDDRDLIEQHLIANNISHDKEIYVDNWLIILLDSSTPGRNLGSGRLNKAELERLSSLVETYPHKNIIVFIHHPPLPFGAEWFRKICLENHDEFNKILRSRSNVKAVITGHAHFQHTCFSDNKLYICAPSTWRQFDHSINERTAYNDMPSGYNWYKICSEGRLEFGTNYIIDPDFSISDKHVSLSSPYEYKGESA